MSLKENVKKLMSEQGIETPYQLSKSIDEPSQKVCNWFQEGRKIPGAYAPKLAKLFGVSIDSLYEFESSTEDETDKSSLQTAEGRSKYSSGKNEGRSA